MTTTSILIVMSILAKLAHGNHMFTSHIYENLRKDVKGNLVYSPLAAETVLAALALGGADGETKQEIIDILEEPDSEQEFEELTSYLYQSPQENITLSPAYKTYISNEYRVNRTFVNKSRRIFGVETENVNFANKNRTAKLINSFVEERSKGRLRDLIDPNELGPKNKIVLVNALYQSAVWRQPFRRAFKDDFYSSPNESEKIDFLSAVGYFRVYHCGYLKARYLELPFRDNNISFFVILPDKDNNLENVEDQIFDYLAPHRLNFLRHVGLVFVKIPKFNTTLELDFKKYLQAVNVEKVFSPTEAELPGISNKKGVYVNSIPQKAFINITERGNDPPPVEVPDSDEPRVRETTTGPVRDDFRRPPRPLPFIPIPVEADRPFIYFIRDNNSTLILFVGRFNNK